MALPKGDQYNEAVQNPRVSFADTELKTAKVETGMFDLPKPYSGGFTVTFKLQTPTTNYAVRCFTRDISDIQRRYQAISSFFASKPSRYFVEAKYLKDGIRVSGTFFPVIKMKWMEGEPLNFYLENNRNNKAKLQTLLSDFLNMVAELESFGIAHGDLQQGNIIVKNDRLFLIDYDGMYLPTLSGLKSNELGHPNFQHPQRSANHYSARIDRFSSIVIYLSLRALIAKPALWKYHNGENIILKSQDIADLNNSPAITELNSIAEIKPLVERFVGICHLDFDKVPSLNEFISGSFNYDKNKVGKIAVKNSQYDVLDAKMKGTILEHFGEKVEVIGYISNQYKGITRLGSSYYFLNVGSYPNQTFTLTVWSEGIAALSSAGKSPTSLVNKWVSAIGIITSYAERPQMIIDSASQIQILNNEQEAKDRLSLKKISPGIGSRNAKHKSVLEQIQERKKIQDKEAEVFNNIYKNIPATPTAQTSPTSKPKPTPPAQHTTKSQTNQPISQTSNKTTSTSTTENEGCSVGIVVAAIFGFIGAGITENVGGFIAGAIGGFILYSIFTTD
ncbi:BUD32 family EKC/KEOPS complex subunit [Lacibacter sediminis]|uniref:Protein kinase domain-containing protein n=1 Tax=Lacibacter sediminis TaxID=2760713 RepID=A0A7G5XLX0_9BACT|nr:hypothetical protein [Lacibacter sediminis]QNA46473.1 hypothetical protein H4075_09965 [Lacibacter sediminis]